MSSIFSYFLMAAVFLCSAFSASAGEGEETDPTHSTDLSHSTIERFVERLKSPAARRLDGYRKFLQNNEILSRSTEWEIAADRLIQKIRNFPGLEAYSWIDLENLLFEYLGADEEIFRLFEFQEWEDEENPPILDQIKIVLGLIELDPLAEFTSLDDDEDLQFLLDHFDENIPLISSLDESTGRPSMQFDQAETDSSSTEIIWRSFHNISEDLSTRDIEEILRRIRVPDDFWKNQNPASNPNPLLPVRGIDSKFVLKRGVPISPELYFADTLGLSLPLMREMFSPVELRPIKLSARKQHEDEIKVRLHQLLAELRFDPRKFLLRHIDGYHRKVYFIHRYLGPRFKTVFNDKFSSFSQNVRYNAPVSRARGSMINTAFNNLLDDPQISVCEKILESLQVLDSAQ